MQKTRGEKKKQNIEVIRLNEKKKVDKKSKTPVDAAGVWDKAEVTGEHIAEFRAEVART